MSANPGLRFRHPPTIAVTTLWLAWLAPAAVPAQFSTPPPISPPVVYAPLQQGGFEIPDQGTGSSAYVYRPTGSSWHFTGGTGLAGNASDFTYLNPPAPEGDQVLFVQGGTGSVAKQSFAVNAGRYRLTLQAAQRIQASGTNDQTVSLRLDGAELAQIHPGDGNYAAVATQSFTIGVGFHLLELVGLNPSGGDNTVFIDDVQLVLLSATAAAWSNPATWGGTVPDQSTDVVIPVGQVVLLDTAAEVRSLTIRGELHCKDDDLGLSAEWIMVHGRFECGSEHSPFLDTLTLTLRGDDDNVMEMGTKVLGVMDGGTLELHGEPRVSWTQLATTAAVNATQLTLASPVDWREGDQIVIAPTREVYDEGEVVTITAVASNGLSVDVTPALAYEHWGEQSTFNNASTSWTLDERAEVGLLSRNLKIEGEDSTETQGGFGGHVMSMVGSTVHVSGIELYRMGQKGKLGRYPFHWHKVGSAPGQYVTNSSIHRSFNRCVTVHRTHDTLVADNVCYDFIGHGYFLEDGNEQGNVFDHNLGIWAKKPARGENLLETDLRDGAASNGPAVFWIAHPDNTYTNNAAAGSEGTGFWYGLSDQVIEGTSIIPLYEPFGTFHDNRAHSSRQGFSSCTNDGGPVGMEPPNEALIENLTVSNVGQGIWPCSSPQTQQNARFVRAMVANTENGMQAPNPTTFEDSLFVAYTDNTPPGAELGSGFSWRGVQVYDQGFLFDNVHFANFDRPAMTAFYPGAGAHKHVNNRGRGFTFESSPNLFLDPDNFVEQVENGPSWWGDVVHDLDGSFVGSGHAVVADHPLMFDGACHQPTAIAIAGYACPYRYAHFRTENFSQIDPVTILRSDGYHETSGHIEQRFINEFIMDDGYFYTYRYTGGMKHERVQVHLRNAFPDDTAVYELLDVPSSYVIATAGWTAAPKLRDLFLGPGRQYFWRDHSLFLKMKATGADWHATDVVEVCMTGTCATGQVHTLDLPAVAITSPADGARFPAGANVVVAASLSDDQGIAAARLYVGTVLVGTDTTAPYNFTLSNLLAGSYALKLVGQDTTGQTYTAVQQLFIGEPTPRVEITSHHDFQTFDAGTPLNVAFNVHNWPVSAGGTHLHWLLDNVDQGHLYTTNPLVVSNLSQGKHKIRIAAAEADCTITAINDTVTIYSVENHVLADFEDGVDRRGSLFPKDALMGPVTSIRFAWGTHDPVASRADAEDDINFYKIGIQGAADSWATYRLELDPVQDWSAFTALEIKADADLVFECFVIDATSGATSLGLKTGTVTTLGLQGLGSLVDEVVAIELRYDEAGIAPAEDKVQHLRHVRLVP